MQGWRGRRLGLGCLVLVAVLPAAGCLDSANQRCRTGIICPAGTRCHPTEPRCLTSFCGDGIIDVDAGEVCDDGNREPEDGCSTDCRSDETCGNGYTDFAVGEECDDGDFRSHDGCSSGCTAELPLWESWVDEFALGRFGHAMVYDSARDRIVLFGGTDSGKGFDDTWEFDGRQWRRLYTRTAPPARYAAAAAYDRSRDRVVLFAGSTVTVELFDDTWEFDGVQWVERQPTRRPPLRIGSMGTYDAARGVTVVFGGAEFPFTMLADTWEWDGNDWIETTPTPSPPARTLGALAYDDAGGRVVLFGGSADPFLTNLFGDTWDYDGTTWRQISAATAPTGRIFHALDYDPDGGRLLLFGGTDDTDNVAFDDLWALDGDAWTDITPANSPGVRFAHRGVYDVARNRFVILGGVNATALVPGTWSFDGSGWADISPPRVPPARRGGALVYDTLRRVVVLFGGVGATGAALGDTWEFDGSSWNLADAVGPAPRGDHGLVYDSRRELTVLFGGETRAGTPLGDTWEYDGIAWRQVSLALAPSPRRGPAMAYVASSAEVVLFGGIAGTTLHPDTWAYDGLVWREVNDGSTGPRARHGARLAFDPGRGVAVLLGGEDILGAPMGDTWFFHPADETWELKLVDPGAQFVPGVMRQRARFGFGFDAARGWPVVQGGYAGPGTFLNGTWELVATEQYDATWVEVDAVLRPPPLESHSLVYDARRGVAVVYGGIPLTTTTWEYRYRGSHPDEQCDNAIDDDGDGLADCDDPDCASDCGP